MQGRPDDVFCSHLIFMTARNPVINENSRCCEKHVDLPILCSLLPHFSKLSFKKTSRMLRSTRKAITQGAG